MASARVTLQFDPPPPAEPWKHKKQQDSFFGGGLFIRHQAELIIHVIMPHGDMVRDSVQTEPLTDKGVSGSAVCVANK